MAVSNTGTAKETDMAAAGALEICIMGFGIWIHIEGGLFMAVVVQLHFSSSYIFNKLLLRTDID